jgi:hypothetical protein
MAAGVDVESQNRRLACKQKDLISRNSQSPLPDSNRRPPLYEEGPCVKWVVFVHRPVMAGVVGVVAGERCSSLYRLLEREDKADGSSLR